MLAILLSWVRAAMSQPLNPVTSGGRIRVRRMLVAAVLVLTARLSAAHLVALDEQMNANVIVREQNGVYRVEAQFVVPETESIAFAVLTDYEEIPRFMPDVQRSAVIERRDGYAVVQQEANPRFMMFSRRVHLVLEVTEGSAAIRFRDRCGKSFSQYEGAWHIRAGQNGTAIMYQLTAKPAFDVPAFLLKRLLRRDASHMIENLRREITARSRTS